MRPRPDGSPLSLDRRVRKTRFVRDYGSVPLGEGFAIHVEQRHAASGTFVDLRIYLAGQPTRKGLALFPDEVHPVLALLERAVTDLTSPASGESLNVGPASSVRPSAADRNAGQREPKTK